MVRYINFMVLSFAIVGYSFAHKLDVTWIQSILNSTHLFNDAPAISQCSEVENMHKPKNEDRKLQIANELNTPLWKHKQVLKKSNEMD